MPACLVEGSRCARTPLRPIPTVRIYRLSGEHYHEMSATPASPESGRPTRELAKWLHWFDVKARYWCSSRDQYRVTPSGAVPDVGGADSERQRVRDLWLKDWAGPADPGQSSPRRPDSSSVSSPEHRAAVRCYHEGMALDERAFFTEKPETRHGRYQCPKCRRTSEYSIRWVRRSKKDRLPAGADEDDRAKFAKLRDYLLRLDDEVTCKTCGRKFEIPSQHSLMFVDQLAGLPNEEDLEREISRASGEPEPAPESSRRFPRGSRASRVAGSRDITAQDADGTEAVIIRAVLVGRSRRLRRDSSTRCSFPQAASGPSLAVSIDRRCPLHRRVPVEFLSSSVNGRGPPASTAEGRRANLHANKLYPSVWALSIARQQASDRFAGASGSMTSIA